MSETEKPNWSNPELHIHQALAMWAAKCAEHTLHVFEAEAPDDKRPRLALEALRSWVCGELEMAQCRNAVFAAHAAARAAKSPAAVAAARATGQAVAVAHMWNHAPHAAAYAAKAAALTASPQEQALSSEREWQWEQLSEDLLPLVFPKGNAGQVS